MGALRGVVDDGLGSSVLRGSLQLVGRVGDGGRQRHVLGEAQEVSQRGQDLNVAAEVHAAGDEASGEQARHLLRAGESCTRVTAEALLLGPAAELEGDAVTVALGAQAQQVLVGAALIQEDGLARGGTTSNAAAVTTREATNALGVLGIARIDGAAVGRAGVHVLRLGGLEVGVGRLGHVRHFDVTFQSRQLHHQLNAAALAVAVQGRREVDQLEDVIAADQADLVVTSDRLASIRGALEAAHLASRLETQAGRHVQVIKAESTASNLDEVVRDGLLVGEVDVVILELGGGLQGIHSFLHARISSGGHFFV